ncbi:unnamed protein product [Dovyalis caffra]|uniref:MutS-like protein n=1 Tax=Dovyalis caffra TaxID=77055 RepID=A0AAV1RRT1_9ROSI|nr:unnamed protein product [Dovyalis caffra]
MHFLEDYKHKTEIDTPYFEYFEIKDTSLGDSSMSVSSALVEACIYGISQVELLLLSRDAMSSVNAVVCDSTLPTFHYLVGEFITWESLPDLLESSPNLEILVFPEASWIQFPFRDLLFLKRMDEVSMALIGINQRRTLKYLLKSAKVLEKMIIRGYKFFGRPRMLKKLEDLRNEILDFPREA